MTFEQHEANAGARYYFFQFMHALFWRTLCPRPDGRFNLALRGWPYSFTGRVAGYFHKKTCGRCRER